MDPWTGDFIGRNSIRLPDGGDTHVHPHRDGLTVTTRLPGGIEFHHDFDSDGNLGSCDD